MALHSGVSTGAVYKSSSCSTTNTSSLSPSSLTTTTTTTTTANMSCGTRLVRRRGRGSLVRNRAFVWSKHELDRLHALSLKPRCQLTPDVIDVFVSSSRSNHTNSPQKSILKRSSYSHRPRSPPPSSPLGNAHFTMLPSVANQQQQQHQQSQQKSYKTCECVVDECHSGCTYRCQHQPQHQYHRNTNSNHLNYSSPYNHHHQHHHRPPIAPIKHQHQHNSSTTITTTTTNTTTTTPVATAPNCICTKRNNTNNSMTLPDGGSKPVGGMTHVTTSLVDLSIEG